MREEEELCPRCNGSGEGMHDGTICTMCKGTGVEREEVQERSYDDIHDELPDEYFDYGEKENTLHPVMEEALKPFIGEK